MRFDLAVQDLNRKVRKGTAKNAKQILFTKYRCGKGEI